MQLFQIPSPPADLVCTPEQAALEERDALLAHSTSIRAVLTQEDNEQCSLVGSNIQTMLRDVESTRKAITAPYLAAQRAIKATADLFCKPLSEDKDRLGRLAAVYRTEQERKAEAERQARAVQLVRLQDQERKAGEDARKASEAGDLAGAIMGELIASAAGVAIGAVIAAPVPEATKTAGQSFRPRQVDFRCVDPIALWNARPDLCNGPTPKASAIKAVCTPEHPVAGLELFYVDKVNFNSR